MIKSYKCIVCGHIHVGSEPPQNCPVCGVSADDFIVYEEQVQEKESNTQFWRCINCEYIHEGSEAPDVCPVCGAGKDAFEPYVKNTVDSTSDGNIKVLIIGSGIAGLTSAEEIRNNSDNAEITLISGEKHLPYYRLNLTRYLAKETDKSSLNIHEQEWYAQKRINIISGKEVSLIDKDKKQVKLDDGTFLEYDRLIVANGAHPFVPPITGSQLKNVVTLRTLDDADFILDKSCKLGSCICIGGGILGLEVAGAIAKSGVKVTLLEGAEWLMPRQLNRKASVILKKYMKGLGIEVRENVKIDEIVGSEECEGVRLSTGELLETKLVIITAGVRPNTYLARKAGLEVNMGLVVNNNMQTSDENIYAAGDVTEHYGMVYGLWNAAQYQGKVAALNAIGMNVQFETIPRSNVLKVLDLDIFSIGEFNPVDGSYYVYENETESSYASFVLRDGRIIGSIVIGDKTLSVKVKQAVEKGLVFPRELYDSFDTIKERL